jgi:hypothetical protein
MTFSTSQLRCGAANVPDANVGNATGGRDPTEVRRITTFTTPQRGFSGMKDVQQTTAELCTPERSAARRERRYAVRLPRSLMDVPLMLLLVACSRDRHPPGDDAPGIADDSESATDTAPPDDSGSIGDVDDDGWDADADCDDTDPNVHPEAEEKCLNGIDDDCNGTVDHCDLCNQNLTAFSFDWVGGVREIAVLETSDDAEVWIAGWGDHHVSGSFVMSARAGLWPASAIHFESEEVPLGLATRSDLDGDGLEDLVVAGGRVYEDAKAWIFSSPVVAADMEAAAADGIVHGPTDGAFYDVEALPGLAATNGLVDGLFFLGTYESWVTTRPLTGSVEIEPDSEEVPGHPVAAASVDIDGDGLNDLVLGGAELEGDTKWVNDREMRLYVSPLPETLDETTADQSWVDIGAGGELVPGDFDGDGRGDVIAAGGHCTNDEPCPFYLVTGGSVSGRLTAVATASFGPSMAFGALALDSGDLDGDDVADLIIAEARRLDEFTDDGIVSILSGPLSGAYSVAEDANAVVRSCKESFEIFPPLVTAGDYDRDGRSDVVTASILFTEGFGTNIGARVRVMPSTQFVEL